MLQIRGKHRTVHFFFLSGFSFTDTDDSQDSKERVWTIFHSFINRTACIYQTATRWDIPPYWIAICLIDDLISFSFFWLLTWWFDSSFFVTAIWDGKPVDSTLIDYQPCITSEPTNQMCWSPLFILIQNTEIESWVVEGEDKNYFYCISERYGIKLLINLIKGNLCEFWPRPLVLISILFIKMAIVI